MPTQMAKHHGAVVPLGKDKVIFYFSFLLRPETEDLGKKTQKSLTLPVQYLGSLSTNNGHSQRGSSASSSQQLEEFEL